MDRDPARALAVLAGALAALAFWAPRNREIFAGAAILVFPAAMMVQGRVVDEEIARLIRRARSRKRKKR